MMVKLNKLNSQLDWIWNPLGNRLQDTYVRTFVCVCLCVSVRVFVEKLNKREKTYPASE